MEIKKLIIEGLHGKSDIEISFERDLTVLTGRNGSGKTNVLKLLWYMISPNLERAVAEIDFNCARLLTDKYSVEVSRSDQYVVFQSREDSFAFDSRNGSRDAGLPSRMMAVKRHRFSELDPEWEFNLENANRCIRNLHTSSLFFPTYRRIEERAMRPRGEAYELKRAIEDYSKRISVDNHRLIASISTSDVKDLIVGEYANLSEKALSLREDLLKEIVSIASQGDVPKFGAEERLKRISSTIEQANKKQSDLFSPYEKMQEMVAHFMRGKSVRISNNISLGDFEEIISADSLSAGEKQILSFLAFNAFFRNSPIIIDEPELSLHVDWQRTLMPTLLGQGSSNQIVVATHSPFIYSRYPEKEIELGRRG